jgi:uncharacterized membrane protein
LSPSEDIAVKGRARWYRPTSILRSIQLRPRIYLAVTAGLLALLLLPHTLSASVREALAWIIGAVVYLGVAVRSMLDCPGDVIAARARRIDDSRMVILGVVLLAIASSFISIAGLINEAKEATRHVKLWYLGLASATILVSWTVTQIVFTLHYAHEYYSPSAHSVGSPGQEASKPPLDFPGEPNPDYWDFLYFATSIGATSQTSDVAVRARSIRRLVTVHAIVSFFFNATVLALTINLAASLI